MLVDSCSFPFAFDDLLIGDGLWRLCDFNFFSGIELDATKFGKVRTSTSCDCDTSCQNALNSLAKDHIRLDVCMYILYSAKLNCCTVLHFS